MKKFIGIISVLFLLFGCASKQKVEEKKEEKQSYEINIQDYKGVDPSVLSAAIKVASANCSWMFSYTAPEFKPCMKEEIRRFIKDVEYKKLEKEHTKI